MQADVQSWLVIYHFYCSFFPSVWVGLVDHTGQLRLAKKQVEKFPFALVYLVYQENVHIIQQKQNIQTYWKSDDIRM